MDVYATRWSFTYTRPTRTGIKRLRDLDLDYLVYTFEVGPTSGVPHLQGYLEFKTPMAFAQVIRLLPKFYLTVARESRDVNRRYCLKNNNGASYIYDSQVSFPTVGGLGGT